MQCLFQINCLTKSLRTEIYRGSANACVRQIPENKFAKRLCICVPVKGNKGSSYRLNICKKRSNNNQVLAMTMKSQSKNLLHRLIVCSFRILVICQQVVKKPFWRHAKRKQQQKKCCRKPPYKLRLCQLIIEFTKNRFFNEYSQ